jgi:hypothetical protein
MPRALSPTGVKPEYLRQCLDVLADDLEAPRATP